MGAAARGGSLGVHSSDCYHHCNTEGTAYSHSLTVDGVALAQVVQSFVFGTAGPTQLVDNCTGTFACGAGCAGAAPSAPAWREA